MSTPCILIIIALAILFWPVTQFCLAVLFIGLIEFWQALGRMLRPLVRFLFGYGS